MLGKVKRVFNLIGNMGWRYTSFRARYELLRRSGLLKRRFPVAPPFKQYITLRQWKAQSSKFFFDGKKSLFADRKPTIQIKETFENLKAGKLLLFNSLLTDLGRDYDWVTNPDSGYKYDIKKHWTEIADLSKEAGDIKFVWEKSRFSYLYDIIRYDHHFNEDCAAMVFVDILSWLDANPVNCGPNYRCSQEMSLRVLNWTFALHYYKDSPVLTDAVFDKMQYAIYWHMHHVYNNIDFSRIAVRNNHAITETLALYLVGIFYPSLPGAKQWKEKGRAWFEEEIAYQIYDDGTFLQYSMNYHRIVAQLLTWALVLSEKNGERFSEVVYDRARKSLIFLRTCMIDENGWLPNYGANDGALFFNLSGAHYRDYRPQLQALGLALGMDVGFGEICEDSLWYGIGENKVERWTVGDGAFSFDKGGYYVIRESDTLTFIKCGGYKDRPSHADNLHLDIWYKGENILLDAGSYKYNTDEATIRYFSGTASHNTVMLDDKDQMLKGGRFIWYYWSQKKSALLREEGAVFAFEGEVAVYQYIHAGIGHRRIVAKKKGQAVWEIRDELVGVPDTMEMRQIWHSPLQLKNAMTISAKLMSGAALSSQVADGWSSTFYGRKEKTKELYFSSRERIIETTIKVGNEA